MKNNENILVSVFSVFFLSLVTSYTEMNNFERI